MFFDLGGIVPNDCWRHDAWKTHFDTGELTLLKDLAASVEGGLGGLENCPIIPAATSPESATLTPPKCTEETASFEGVPNERVECNEPPENIEAQVISNACNENRSPNRLRDCTHRLYFRGHYPLLLVTARLTLCQFILWSDGVGGDEQKQHVTFISLK
jgi:hypothetical protein